MALFEAVKEVMFIVELLQSMKPSVKVLLTVKVDNVRSIFMAGNITATSCTKHVDIS